MSPRDRYLLAKFAPGFRFEVLWLQVLDGIATVQLSHSDTPLFIPDGWSLVWVRAADGGTELWSEKQWVVPRGAALGAAVELHAAASDGSPSP